MPRPERPAAAAGHDAPGGEPGDLGFRHRVGKSGAVEIRHHGRLAATLRGADAVDFVGDVDAGGFADGQQLMARVTGHYKHGNERLAASHPRNRR